MMEWVTTAGGVYFISLSIFIVLCTVACAMIKIDIKRWEYAADRLMIAAAVSGVTALIIVLYKFARTLT